ncbi:MAG TPA: RsiV family protein, partial [Gammaproteobacteria bacterium]|nr:RsiV family protein [Gammaproteobacteria bacterium]
AHPYHHHFVLNYDLKNNQPLELGMLFNPNADYLTVLSTYTQMTLSNRHLPDKEMIAAGTAPKPENFRNWNIKPNGLLITFDEYQVAPYVNGTQTVLVPYSFLKSILNPTSPVTACVIHKKQCSRSNLLTGGFIDEALNLKRINSQHGGFNPTLSKL